MKTLPIATVTMVVGLAVTHQAAAQDVVVSVRLRNDAQIREDLLTDARSAVTQLYAKAGVKVVWVHGGAAITVVLATRDQAERLHQATDTVGFAPGSDADRGRLAYVFTHRVEAVSAGYHAAHEAVLGAAIAHEMGHLLLPYNSHSKRGIMRASLNQSDFKNARRGELLFTADQAAQIRGRMTKGN